MKKIDMVYREIMERKVVNDEDLTEIIRKVLGRDRVTDRRYFYIQYLNGLLGEGKIVRIRRGLYAGVDVFSGSSLPVDRYIVASRIRRNYYLGYHTALELHGCAHSSFTRCFTVVDRRSKFEPFTFGSVRFQPVLKTELERDTQEIRYSDRPIRVSGPSRTFVECLDRPDLCGGWEESLKSLESLAGVNVNDVLDVLSLYDKNVLYRKCGYVLELMMERSMYYGDMKRDGGLPPIGEGAPVLFIRKNAREAYSDRWRLFLPADFSELLRGG